MTVPGSSQRWQRSGVAPDLRRTVGRMTVSPGELDRIQGRLDAIEGRLEAHVARFDRVDAQLAEILTLLRPR